MPDEQLQLFDVPGQPARLRRSATPSLGHATLRHDHAVLLAMIVMIAASMLFAFGVERGKHVVQAERSRSSVMQTASAPEAATIPTPAPQTRPSKLASSEEARFAVQVVSYRQAKFAQRELQQLQRQGENAFLLQRQGKTTVMVGPFLTKEHAASNVSRLRQRYRERYRDCFIRTL